ncbi:MAG: hypothetical protein WDZ94_00260 [Patescibacteria group bacterium]
MSANTAQKLVPKQPSGIPQGGKAFHFPEGETENSHQKLSPFAQAVNNTQRAHQSPDSLASKLMEPSPSTPNPEDLVEQQKKAAEQKARAALQKETDLFNQRKFRIQKEETDQLKQLRMQLKQLSDQKGIKQSGDTAFQDDVVSSVEGEKGKKGFWGKMLVDLVAKNPANSDNWMQEYESKGTKQGFQLGEKKKASSHLVGKHVNNKIQNSELNVSGGE